RPTLVSGLRGRLVGNASARADALCLVSGGDAATTIAAMPRHAALELGRVAFGFLDGVPRQERDLGCTAAVEAAVHRHLDDQLHFLEKRDTELRDIIQSIRVEELAHLHHAEQQLHSNAIRLRLLRQTISAMTDVLIWLSTWGDSTLMARVLAASAARQS